MSQHTIGIDIGTQSLKAVVTSAGMAVSGEASVAYRPDFPRPGWAEQHPALWIDALKPAIGAALEAAGLEPADVGALGIAGQLDGCLPVDSATRPLGPCIIWMDRRATEAVAGLPAEAIMAKSGVVLDATHMAAKIRWLKAHHPEAARIARYHQPVSFLVARLTGRQVFDHALASTTMLYNLTDGAFDAELCGIFGIAPDELPEIARSETVADSLSSDGAALTGLPRGIPVAVGTGDDFSNPLGAGVVAPGRVVAALGTAEVVGAVHDLAVTDPGALVETHGYAGAKFFIENPGWLSGGVLSWFVRSFRLLSVGELDALAATAAPGSDGLTFLPALSGAMAPEWVAEARGAFYGLTPAHGTGAMARAVLEGCAFAMRDVVDRLDEMGVDTTRVLLLGGGARSRLWAEIRAGVLDRPVDLSAVSDASPLGAALLAAVASGQEESLASGAAQLDRLRETLDPHSDDVGAYEEAYRRYRDLFAALKPLYRR
ncbi:MAG: xylulokinase [Kiloniellales bacterium]